MTTSTKMPRSPSTQATPPLAVTLGGVVARTDASDDESGQVPRFDPFEGVLPAGPARTWAEPLPSSSSSSSPWSLSTLAEGPDDDVEQSFAQNSGPWAARASLDERRMRARLVLLGGGLAATFATLGAIGMGAALFFGAGLRTTLAPTLLQQPVAAAMSPEVGPVARPRPAPPVAGYEALRAGDSGWFAQDGSWRVEGDALLGRGGQVISSAELADGTLELDVELVDGLDAAVGDGAGLAVGVGFRARPVARRSDASGYGANFRLGTDTFNLFKGIDGDWDVVDPAFPTYHPSPAVDPVKNHVVVRAAGGSFAITVNDRPLASFEDDSFPKGRITLWVHSAQATVRFSNIRITPN